MSARNNLNPNQLKMFMTAHEITAQYQGNDSDRGKTARGEENDADLLTRKYREAQDSPLASSVRQSGVQFPVELTTEGGRYGKPQVADGHHRLAVEAFENRHRLMPVEHHRTRLSAAGYRAES